MKARIVHLTTLMVFAAISLNLEAQQPKNNTGFLPSDKLNKKLPQWLRFNGEYRSRLEGFTGGGFRPNNDDAYVLSRIRINMKIQPTDWLRFGLQGQDARVFGKNQNPPVPPFQNTMNLRLAYVELGDAEKRAVGVRVGRQELAFGEERLIGNTNWLNTARSFDAVRASFRHKGYRLDAFGASVVNFRQGKLNRSVAGNNIYGLYGALGSLVPKATVEPYFFWRRASNQLTGTARRGMFNFATVGFRWVGKLPANFDYGTEIAGQTGSLGTDDIGAWAGHWILAYTVPHARYQPRIMAEYNYASGDDPRNSKRGTFDNLYPTNHDKYGLADQVGWRNIHHLRSGLELKPHAKWTLMGRYSSWWLASPRDALYNAAGAPVAKVADGSAGRYVGQELDFQAIYTLSKQMQVGGGYAYLFPGTFLKKATPGHAYSFPYLSFNYLF